MAIAGALAAVPFAVSSAEPRAAEKYDPDNVVAISQYMELVAKGMALFTAKDPTGAIDTFKKAHLLAPRNPLASYLLAETYASQGNYGEAEAAIAQGLEPNDAKTPPIVRSHLLFLAADVAERQKKWPEAKAAWQAYAEHAPKVDGGAFPATAAERMKIAERAAERAKVYAAVRERIANEKDAGKPPAPKK